MAYGYEDLLESDVITLKILRAEFGVRTGRQAKTLYSVSGLANELEGTIEEDSTENLSGAVKRFILSHNRSVTFFLVNKNGEKLLEISRPFSLFRLFSKTTVKEIDGKSVGAVERTMLSVRRQWTLRTASGNVVATVRHQFVNILNFSILDEREEEKGIISYNFQLGELRIDFGTKKWKKSQRVLILAAAVAVDWDYVMGGMAYTGGHG